MREHTKQRVQCTRCAWSGGRAASASTLLAPCSKCGGEVERLGEVYLEERVLAGCTACSWWGEVQPARLGGDCRRCGTLRSIESVLVVTRADGYILA